MANEDKTEIEAKRKRVDDLNEEIRKERARQAAEAVGNVGGYQAERLDAEAERLETQLAAMRENTQVTPAPPAQTPTVPASPPQPPTANVDKNKE